MFRLFSMMLLLLASAFGAQSLASQATWTGAVSNDWFSTGNWSPAPPTSITDVTIPAGTPFSPRIFVAGPGVTTAVKGLTVAPGATLTIDSGAGGNLQVNCFGHAEIQGAVIMNRNTAGSVTLDMTMGGVGFGPVVVSGSLTLNHDANPIGGTVTVKTWWGLNVTGSGVITSCSNVGVNTIYTGNVNNAGTITCTSLNPTIWHTQIIAAGSFINTGSMPIDNARIYALYTTPYSLSPTVTYSSVHPLTIKGFAIQFGVVGGSLTLTCNLTVTIPQNSGLSHTSGAFVIGSGVTVTTWGYQSNPVLQPHFSLLVMTNASSRLVVTNSFEANINTTTNITAGVIEARGSISIASVNFHMDGGEFFVSGTATITMSAVGAGVFFHDVTLGSGSTLDSISPYGTLDIRGNLAVRPNAAVNVQPGVNIYLAGDLANSGTLSGPDYSISFVGTSVLSGSGYTAFDDFLITSTGTVISSPGSISVTGNFSNQGSFNANGGSVYLVGTSTAQFSGSTTFANFVCNASGKTLEFAASSTTTVTSYFALGGTSANPVKLRSSTLGSATMMNCTGAKAIGWVDVKDSTAAPSIDASMGGLDSGGNTGWVFDGRVDVVAEVGTPVQVFANDTGGGNGIQAGKFTVKAQAGTTPTLNEVDLQASGTGNDSNAYTQIAIYQDTGGTIGSYDPGVDTLFKSLAGSFSTDNGTKAFFGPLASTLFLFTPGEQRTFFVVVKFNSATLPPIGATFQLRISLIFAYGINTQISVTTVGVPTAVMSGAVIKAPAFNVTDRGGSTNTVLPGATNTLLQAVDVAYPGGPNNTLSALTVEASGSGNDLADYTAVKLYMDANSNSTFESASDTLVNSQTAFSANNGTVSFLLTGTPAAFVAGNTKVFFIVGDFAAGATLDGTFKTRITGGTTSYSATLFTGVPAPAAFSAGALVAAPNLVVADASSASVQSALPATGGWLLQRFTVTYAVGGPTNTITSITLAASGTGNDASAYSSVALYRDVNSNGTYESGVDALVDTVASFAADDGSLAFTLSGSESQFAPGTTTNFLVVAAFNASPVPGATFKSRVTAASGAQFGSLINGMPAPAAGFTAGIAIAAPAFTVTDTSPAVANAYLGLGDFTLQRLQISYPAGPANTLTSLTFEASGTGNDQADYSSLALYRDANSNGTFETSDTLVGSTTAFPANDGSVTFTLTGAEANFSAGTTRVYFLVAGFNTNSADQASFKSRLASATTPQFSSTVNGAPAPAAFSPGLLLLDTTLRAAFTGPSIVNSVASSSSGLTGNGELLCDVTLSAGASGAWTVASLTFVASGSGAHDAAFSQLGLYQDNGNGIWDGATLDTAAAVTAVAFNPATFDVTFALTSPAFTAGQVRRFFLAGILNGTASTGDTFNARLNAASATPAVAGLTLGVPTPNSAALIINTSILSVNPGPASLTAFTHRAGTALSRVVAQYRLSATNDDIDVTGITLTAGGTGNWLTDVSAVEIWRDDGDGAFDSALDGIIFTGPGAASINAVFTSPVTVAHSGHEDLWVRISLTATAGSGAATPQSFTLAVASTTDVATSGSVGVVFGSGAPQSAALSVVDFFVTTCTPAVDIPTGGAPITITGSGFAAPFAVFINGVRCGGTPVITPTQVTGLFVPPGVGAALAITVESGALAPITLTQKFTYQEKKEESSEEGGSCSSSDLSDFAAIMLAALLAVVSLAARAHRRAFRN